MRLFFISCVCLSIALSNCLNKYCNPELCDGSKEHTMCLYQSPGPAEHCVNYERTVKNEKDRRSILDKINSRRNKVAAGEIRSLPPAEDMLAMEWNSELEQFAQRWADQCVAHSAGDRRDTCRDLDSISVGQNIATVYGEAPGLVPASLVDVWYMGLLNINSSMLSEYRRLDESGSSQYEYFTQLMWADTYQVGCGGVRFNVISQNSGIAKNRTVYRLVCNFAPVGNREGVPVYTPGLGGPNCTYGLSETYKALCNSKNEIEASEETADVNKAADTLEQDFEKNITQNVGTLTADNLNLTEADIEADNETFDYFSHLYGLSKEETKETTPTVLLCKNDMAIEDIFEMLKRKLSNNPKLNELFTKKSSCHDGNTESTFTDASVAAFANKIYSKKGPSTTTEISKNEFVNSTLLMDLIENVIFRSPDTVSRTAGMHTVDNMLPKVSPIKIQVETAKHTTNQYATGHLFFPEDEEEDTVEEMTESYYDSSNSPAISDVIMEIEDLRKNLPTKDFLDEVFDTDAVTRSTTYYVLSPDDMSLRKSGHSNMINFLKTIEMKRDNDVKQVAEIKYT